MFCEILVMNSMNFLHRISYPLMIRTELLQLMRLLIVSLSLNMFILVVSSSPTVTNSITAIHQHRFPHEVHRSRQKNLSISSFSNSNQIVLGEIRTFNVHSEKSADIPTTINSIDFTHTTEIDLSNLNHQDEISETETESKTSTVSLLQSSVLDLQSETSHTIMFPEDDEGREPPTYLTKMYESLSTDEYLKDIGSYEKIGSNEVILKAILPTQITNSHSSQVTLSMTGHCIEEFRRANLILTLKDDGINLPDDDDEFAVHIIFKSASSLQQVQHSLTMREESKFYSFDVTTMIKDKLMETGDRNGFEDDDPALHPAIEAVHHFKIECFISSYMSKRSIAFHDLFNTENDAPFILLTIDQIELATSFGVTQSSEDFIPPLKFPENWNFQRRKQVRERRKRRSPAIRSRNSRHRGSRSFTSGLSSHSVGTSPSTSTTSTSSTTEETTPMNPPQIVPTKRTEEFRPIVDSDHYQEAQDPEVSGDSVSLGSSVIGILGLPKKQPAYPSFAPNPKICRRFDWLVKPSDLSLENVIRPTLLDLGYCAGSCPFPLENDVYNFSLHSYLVDQYRFYNGFSTPMNIRPSQCIPIEYKPLMVLVREDDGGYAVIVLDDASVASCGCR